MISMDKIVDSLEDIKIENEMYNNLLSISNKEILVGIPEENVERVEEGESSPNNASLLYLHTNGSPLKNIPPRPVLEPAIAAPENAKRIEEDLKQVTDLLLDRRPQDAEKMMQITGQDAVNMAKDWFHDPRNNWAPNAPMTIMMKINKLRGKARKKALLAHKLGEQTSVPLIDTGQMRDAITFVVRDKTND
jgi:hypothetical protein